jgi:hypothetical protein
MIIWRGVWCSNVVDSRGKRSHAEVLPDFLVSGNNERKGLSRKQVSYHILLVGRGGVCRCCRIVARLDGVEGVLGSF